MNWSQLATALTLSILIVLVARWRGWLSASGSLGALVMGTLVFGLGGWSWGGLLIVFFVSSSLLSRFRTAEKTQAAEKFDKDHQRDVMQVVANGGVGVLAVLGHALWPSPLWYLAFVGALATVTADTWATELGTLVKQPPRLITTGARVEVGTSGGVSLGGTLAALAGALAIGVLAGLLREEPLGSLALIGACSGLTGALVDSLLGATLQRIYLDDRAQKETEKRIKYGRVLSPVRGWPWVTNDVVNLLASLTGGLMAAGLGY